MAKTEYEYRHFIWEKQTPTSNVDWKHLKMSSKFTLPFVKVLWQLDIWWTREDILKIILRYCELSLAVCVLT
jgi:hypothetical protein